MPASSKEHLDSRSGWSQGSSPFVSLFPFFFSPSLSLFAGANSIFERPYLMDAKAGATRREVSALLPARDS
jgi:hypothetical protein